MILLVLTIFASATYAEAPVLTFYPPTEDDNSTIYDFSTEVNLSINTQGLKPDMDSFKFVWNGTEYNFFDDSLVLALNFNNNTFGDDQTTPKDISKMGNNAAVRGSALKFYGGCSNYVNCRNASSLSVNGPVSFEVWAKVTNNSEYANILSKRNEYVLRYMSSVQGFVFYLYDGEDYAPQVSTAAVNLAEWYHVVGTWDGVNQSIYLNGVLHETIERGFTASPDTSDALIGRGNTDIYFDGSIDEVRMYNRTLSATEIAEHYNGIFANETGLVLYVPFSDASGSTATDYSSLGNNGTLTAFANTSAGAGDSGTHGWTTYGRPGWTNRGKYGYGMSLNGIDDYIDCGNDSSLDVTGSLTLEAWIKPEFDNSTDSNHIIVDKLMPGADGGYRLLYNKEQLGFRFRLETSGGGYYLDVSNAAVSKGNWHHIAATYDGSNLTVYLNGVYANSASQSPASINSSTSSLVIGSQYDGGAHFFNGSIDEVRVYNRTLTAAEILMHYQSELQYYTLNEYRFYVNITNLSIGTYSYYGWATNIGGETNTTGTRSLTVSEMSTSTSTTTTTTTTTQIGECVLVGNYAPCDEVTLEEVIEGITLWSQEGMSLGDVIDLINAWADPVTHPAN